MLQFFALKNKVNQLTQQTLSSLWFQVEKNLIDAIVQVQNNVSLSIVQVFFFLSKIKKA